jgi:hypothetical protein
MNERIKELERECWEPRKHPVSQASMGDKFNTEKFAELIVREVLAVQEQFIAEGHNAWHLNKPTKNHFGISE